MEGYWKEEKCPICGKEFFPTKEWAYNAGGYKPKRVCSYHCSLEAERIRESKSRKRQHKGNVIPAGRDEEIQRLAAAGTDVQEIANKYDLTRARVLQIIREGKPSK